MTKLKLPVNWLILKKALIILIYLSINIESVSALDELDRALIAPVSLHNAKLDEPDDIRALMQSDVLKQEMISLAKNVNQQLPLAISTADNMAIMTLLDIHEKTLVLVNAQKEPLNYFYYRMYSEFYLSKKSNNKNEKEQLTCQMQQALNSLSNKELNEANYSLGWSLSLGRDYLLGLFKHYRDNPNLSSEQAVRLVSNYQLYRVYDKILPISQRLLPEVLATRYIIEPDVLIKTKDGVTLSAVVVRQRGSKGKQPSAFQFTIYADEKWHINSAVRAASNGYVGVIANTRGKRSSLSEIVPWEHDGKDANEVIDWISKQSWSNGDVVMYGGSYNGFTQWAATKYMHPALKAIAPYSAANPMTGLPIQNNIFITPNYQWAFHVTNNKTMDHSVYADWEHWNNVYKELFESGRAFKDIDKIEGTPNPWFQKWLSHPEFDEYYQEMLPYQQDYSKINIPVLSVTGYFDGGQISAIDFLKRHYQYNPNANHTLLIGPYSHGTAQGKPRKFHGNYKLDLVALSKDTEQITFEWFDHILRGKPKPALLKDKINYQLMGSNTWQHVRSYNGLNLESITFTLASDKDSNGHYLLKEGSIAKLDYVEQTVDLSDRIQQHNVEPSNIIVDNLDRQTGLVFITEPMKQTVEYAGAVTGYFSIAINKKDVDIGFNLYEIDSQGKAFHLAHYMSRASYAKNMGKRNLLIPEEKTYIPIVNGRMSAKLIEKGNRIALVVDVNKNYGAQVNMGTGKDVSYEIIEDAGQPLQLKWFNDSQINLPLKVWKLD
ncbi:CocE/NonD family hydrolase [Alteromonas sp. 5E99-2]|uniref:CocE/NonD family hydrolase n=1 Tax=Alteromonas sp. 5E99-2 TaxID=2817683 RepID=UPI001A999405|nr:CocE/NonD family hydrolase [Alteromonas sp. 5E99-2]MBO1255967.1 CocE/NonD family hydrolase [Alteromonas sp. 5E99-2]